MSNSLNDLAAGVNDPELKTEFSTWKQHENVGNERENEDDGHVGVGDVKDLVITDNRSGKDGVEGPETWDNHVDAGPADRDLDCVTAATMDTTDGEVGEDADQDEGGTKNDQAKSFRESEISDERDYCY